MPALSERALSDSDVAILCICTIALGTTCEAGSRTVPVIDPVVLVCAERATTKRHTGATRRNIESRDIAPVSDVSRIPAMFRTHADEYSTSTGSFHRQMGAARTRTQ